MKITDKGNPQPSRKVRLFLDEEHHKSLMESDPGAKAEIDSAWGRNEVGVEGTNNDHIFIRHESSIIEDSIVISLSTAVWLSSKLKEIVSDGLVKDFALDEVRNRKKIDESDKCDRMIELFKLSRGEDIMRVKHYGYDIYVMTDDQAGNSHYIVLFGWDYALWLAKELDYLVESLRFDPGAFRNQ